MRVGDKEAQLRMKGLVNPEGRRKAEGSSATGWQRARTLVEEEGEKNKSWAGARATWGRRNEIEVEENRRAEK